jgi:diacylglycerol kinase (ATP)
LGIPLDLHTALGLLTGDYAVRNIDAIQVENRFFVINVSTGVSSLTMRHTQRSLKRRWGPVAYIWRGIKWLVGFQPRRFSIVVDGEPRRLRASEVVVANSGVIGLLPFRWGAHVRLDDGKLDVCILRVRTVPDYLRLIWNILLGQQKRDPDVRYLSAERSIIINTDQPLPVQGDGEVIGHTPVQVQVAPKAVDVIVPAGVEDERR